MRRAVETADIFYLDTTKESLDELRELDFGDCEEKTGEEINESVILAGWLAMSPDAAFPGGETLGHFVARLTKGISAIARTCKEQRLSTAAIVAHGGVLMGLLSALGSPSKPFFAWESENCGGFVTEFDPDTLSMTVLDTIGSSSIW